MFIKETATTNKSTGKVYKYHKLMEAVPSGKGPRQRMVMYLGTLAAPKEEWPQLAGLLEAALTGKQALIVLDRPLAELADELISEHVARREARESRRFPRKLVSVDLASVTTSATRPLGVPLVAHTFWGRLGFPEALRRCGFGAEAVAAAEILVLGKLLVPAPGSKESIYRSYRDSSALKDFLEPLSVLRSTFFHVADRLVARASAIEEALSAPSSAPAPASASARASAPSAAPTAASVVPKAFALIALDGGSIAQRVVLALGVDENGLVVSSRISCEDQAPFDGHSAHSGHSALSEDLLAGLASHGQGQSAGQGGDAKPTLLLPGAIATAETLAAVTAAGYVYIVERPTDGAWVAPCGDPEKVRDSSHSVICAWRAPWGTGSRVLYLIRPSGPREIARKVSLALSSGRLSSPTRVRGGVRFRWRGGPSAGVRQAVGTPGATWTLETSCPDLSAAEVWRRFTLLSRVAQGFRALGVAAGPSAWASPHSGCGPAVADVFAAVLAYRIVEAVEHTLQAAGGGPTSWARVVELLSTYTRHTVNLSDGGSAVFRLRVSDKPEPQHKEILDRLGVVDADASKLTRAGAAGPKSRSR